MTTPLFSSSKSESALAGDGKRERRYRNKKGDKVFVMEEGKRKKYVLQLISGEAN